ncbi:hypothetical protein SEA_BLUECRAB_80 [Mycobacterium phage BlueCrab]|nr:hypothetical protein SEA_BLUECRAB_80 [Mycobacterium phage BlueCrab]
MMTQRKGGFDWIRSTYRVPAKRGMRVVFDGRPGRILSVDGPYLMLHLDSDPEAAVDRPRGCCRPGGLGCAPRKAR